MFSKKNEENNRVIARGPCARKFPGPNISKGPNIFPEIFLIWGLVITFWQKNEGWKIILKIALFKLLSKEY